MSQPSEGLQVSQPSEGLKVIPVNSPDLLPHGMLGNQTIKNTTPTYFWEVRQSGPAPQITEFWRIRVTIT